MDSYSFVRPGKLKLKGEKKKKHHKRHHESKPKVEKTERILEADAHGGWWSVKEFDEVKDSIAIQVYVATDKPLTADGFEAATHSGQDANNKEFTGACYLSATDEGLVVIGPPRKYGEPPAPEEIFTAMQVSDTKVAFKSGLVSVSSSFLFYNSNKISFTMQFTLICGCRVSDQLPSKELALIVNV